MSQSVVADSEVQHIDLFELQAAKHNPAIVNGVARIWTEDFGNAVTFIKVNSTTSNPRNFDNGVICSSFTDASCLPNSPKTAWVQTVLGICESAAELGCIDSVSFESSTVSSENLTPVSLPITLRAEDVKIKIPRGSTMSLWEASDGTRYVVAAIVQSHLQSGKNVWISTTSSISLSIVRVRRDYVIPASKAEMRTDTPTRPGEPVLSLTGGHVGPTLEFQDGSSFKLAVRVPNNVNGFFRGRIANAVVSSASSSADSTTYVLQGDVSPVYVAGAETNSDDPNSPARDGFATGYFRTTRSSTQIDDYGKWKSLIGDNALTTRSYWRVMSSVTGEQRCFESGKKILGLVSSNASFYSDQPPAFNSTTGTFDYKVASPHFDENGDVASGRFSLSVPLSVLRCLYGTDVIPGTAEVSFTYADGSPPQTVQQSVTVSGDWANVSVSGFHFSAPLIRSRFTVPYRTKLAKGKSISLKNISKTKSSQRAKWSTSGPCKISGTKLVAFKRSGTCKVTLKVLDSQKKYVVALRRNFKVS